MTLKHPRPHHGHASEYQVSGIPYVTSSNAPGSGSDPYRIPFPRVTQFVTINVFGSHDVHVGFTENGVKAPETANYFVVESGAPATTIPVRCKELWVRSDNVAVSGVSVCAGLTGCPEFLVLTGSGGPHGDWEGVG